MTRVTTQFIGAAQGGWGSREINVFVGSEKTAKAHNVNLSVPAGFVAGRNNTDNIWINAGRKEHFGKAGNIGRALIHEYLHQSMTGARYDSAFGHGLIDDKARGLLKTYGMGDGGCSSVGGFMGMTGYPFGGFPSCD